MEKEYLVVLSNDKEEVNINLQDVAAKIEILDTPKGKLLSAILEAYPDSITIKPMGTVNFNTNKSTLTGFKIV